MSGADQDQPVEPGYPPEDSAGLPRQGNAEQAVGLAILTPADDDLSWLGAGVRAPGALTAGAGQRPARRRRPPRPAAGLAAMIVLAFVVAFFAWFAAAPFWLTVGHAQAGVATVANCPISGIDRRCATFAAAGNAYTAQVTLLGPAAAAARTGQRVDAEMVSRSSTIAYAGDRDSLYLRWIPAFAIVALCAAAMARASGAHRVEHHRLAVTLAVAMPLAVAAAIVALPVL